VLAVAAFKTEEEALALANSSEFGLAAAVMTEDLDRAARVADALEAGIVWINCSQPNFLEPPWGGMKRSGIGRELGIWGLNNFLEPKQITAYLTRDPWGWYRKP
jgi:betaine-aldehyde dehydrogenase